MRAPVVPVQTIGKALQQRRMAQDEGDEVVLARIMGDEG